MADAVAEVEVDPERQQLMRDLEDVGGKLDSPPADLGELLKLLDLAWNYLSRVGQAPSDTMCAAFFPLLKALICRDLLDHSEMDVKITLATCFAEITKIASPFAPYGEDMMKDFFRIIVDALKDLDDSSSPSYAKKVLVLETVSQIHYFFIMLDRECDDLIVEMFQHFLKTPRPVTDERVFSFMETIMTKCLEESNDILLARLLESVVNDIKKKSSLPVVHRLGEKVIRNCAGKLRPYLIKLVQSNDSSCNDYGDIIASICQENCDTSELNLPRFSGERLAIEACSKSSERTISHKLPQESGRVDPEVDCLLGTTTVESSMLAMTNNTIQRPNSDYVIKSSSLENKSESYCGVGQFQIPKIVAAAKPDGSNSEKSLAEPRDTAINFQSVLDNALLVPGSRTDHSNYSCGYGASCNDQKEREQLPSEETQNQIMSENNAHVGKPLRKLCKRTHSQTNEESESNIVNLCIMQPEKECQTRRRTPSRKLVEMVLVEQPKSKSTQQMRHTICKKNLAGKKILKRNGEKTTKGSVGQVTGMESADCQKSKIEKLTGKLIIQDDLSGDRSLTFLEEEHRENEALVGSKIQIWWPIDVMYYPGVVDSFDPLTKKHKIIYYDGDVELLLLKDECWKLITDNCNSVLRTVKKKRLTCASPDMSIRFQYYILRPPSCGSSSLCAASRWSFPPRGVVKLNVDAAGRPSGSGYAGILRDADGRFIEGFTRHIQSPDPLFAECFVILMALYLLSSRTYTAVIIESDALEAITYISSATQIWPWRLRGLLTDVRYLFNEDASTGISIVFTHRTVNQVAHFLASSASLGPPFQLLSVPPEGLQPIMDNDILN